MKTRIYVINILAILLLFVPVAMMAQSDWTVSDDKQNTKNPVTFSEQSVNAGKGVYMINCKSCHGDPTKNNVLAALVPKPTDLGIQAFLDKNSDGSIFYKITEGKATMPQFGSILSEDDRWNIVNYIRSFDANFEAPVGSTTTEVVSSDGSADGITGPYEIQLFVDEANHKVDAKLIGQKDGNKIAVPNAELFVGIKRYFSNLPVMSVGATTDANGIIQSEYPHDLPGNEDGKGFIIAYPVDTEKYGEINAEAEISLEAIHPVDFASIRALWAGNQNVPIWLIVTYLSMVLIVWGTMFKVVLNIIKIKKIGN